LKEHRNAELRARQKANEVLKTVLADATIKNPSAEVTARLTVLKTQTHELDLDSGTIEGVLRDLKNAPRAAAGQHLGETEFLQRYAAQEDQHISIVLGHSQLKTVGAQ
jgi:hypothetical protein